METISDNPSFTSSSLSKGAFMIPGSSCICASVRTGENHCGYCGIYYHKTQSSLRFPIMGTSSSHLSYLVFTMLQVRNSRFMYKQSTCQRFSDRHAYPSAPILGLGSYLFFYRGISSPGTLH